MCPNSSGRRRLCGCWGSRASSRFPGQRSLWLRAAVWGHPGLSQHTKERTEKADLAGPLWSGPEEQPRKDIRDGQTTALPGCRHHRRHSGYRRELLEPPSSSGILQWFRKTNSYRDAESSLGLSSLWLRKQTHALLITNVMQTLAAQATEPVQMGSQSNNPLKKISASPLFVIVADAHGV